jgi:hypothetical protein
MSDFKLIEGDVTVYNTSGSAINPATQETLALIKDTDGIKKITDALPTGDNWIGKVKVGDGTNNASIIQDGAIYRLAVNVPVISSSSLTTNVSQLLRSGSPNMNVDGSVTPAIFTKGSDATYDISLVALNIGFSTGNFDWNGAGFGDGGSLTNGLLIEATVNNGVSITLANIKLNEDFTRICSIPTITQAGVTDHMLIVFNFTGTLSLKAGTADNIKMTVRDNLALAARDVKYLTATVLGNLVIP